MIQKDENEKLHAKQIGVNEEKKLDDNKSHNQNPYDAGILEDELNANDFNKYMYKGNDELDAIRMRNDQKANNLDDPRKNSVSSIKREEESNINSHSIQEGFNSNANIRPEVFDDALIQSQIADLVKEAQEW
eukprot:CAMPEP_0114583916 /NCGR_PEP_ID=MMETSP0125-20121206/7591_1 /TAXON_ID=485358 ORGANISM="Aristerostoma sp., Strain ATCC 50986" /NCGR_SAMPLE_ID=MMETSP0125 /ASSEMBLY_ACC=CAM_ASM_000245 /LENGTH=131 /DNA_ID=CAMNT_0001777735 /DNA_START=1163 /DNA_END=1555 /DNA_ORIENTATION=+